MDFLGLEFVVCVLFEVDFWIIFGCKECAQTLFLYSSSAIKNHCKLIKIELKFMLRLPKISGSSMMVFKPPILNLT